jgi:hypothetical protein
LNDNLMRDFINKFKWTYAKTYAKICPHEYIVKDNIDQDQWDGFVEAVAFIREKGFTAKYKSRSGEYYILDDRYYWTMGAPVKETTILNRAKLSDYQLIDNAWVWNGDSGGNDYRY